MFVCVHHVAVALAQCPGHLPTFPPSSPPLHTPSEQNVKRTSLKQTSLFCGWLTKPAVEDSVGTASAAEGG